MIVSKPMTVSPTGGITVDTDAYTAGDVVGGLLTFDVSSGMGGGLINRVRVVDEDNQSAAFNLYLFNAVPTTIADDAAFASAVTIADVQKLVCKVSIGSYTTLNSIDYYHSAVLNYAFTSDAEKLYGYLVANGSTPNFTNADAVSIYLEILTEGN